MRWFDADISFGPEDHPYMELSDRNLSFIVKILIGCHKVVKTESCLEGGVNRQSNLKLI
jgi:hypothetical protein